MKRILLSMSILVTISLNLAYSQTISNITAAQRTDGSMIVDIYYDLSGPGPTYTINCEASFDGGTNYSPIINVTGDIGPAVVPGNGKLINWNIGTENPAQFSSQTIVKLVIVQQPGWNCGDILIDTRDNQNYNTIQIGTQCWMAENLNIGTMIAGNTNQANNSTIEKYCYNNNISNCDLNGGFYQWEEMMQYLTTQGTQGICPQDWHLPTDNEWCILEQEVDPTVICSNTGWRGTDVGTKLKVGGSSGFEAILAGRRLNTGVFDSYGTHADFWTSTQSSSNAWRRDLRDINANDYRDNVSKSYGFSVRCVKDNLPPAWSCGQPLPVTHTAGDIAPVNKSVNYGTVETNLTGSNKCWITQNLGSDHQAVSATDATEESAGWYWQFNRKQGYKHDGTTRTPNTTWITSLNENSDWLPANDPCTLLLGTGWRLPTLTEWTNTDANGGWNNRDQTFASLLKLHAAGYLGEGSLYYRGSSGYYWSSTQGSSIAGWYLFFGSGYSDMHDSDKAFGFWPMP